MRILLLAILLVGAPFLAADTESEPPPSQPTGPLSSEEERFQGDWEAYSIEYDRVDYAMTFEGRNFQAVGYRDGKATDERYEGYIVIRSDEQPAQIDFVVLPQPGRISKGIFHFDEETIVVKAPESGLPRPRVFEKTDGPIARLRLSRAE